MRKEEGIQSRVESRLKSRLTHEAETGCMVWTGARRGKGYGTISVAGRLEQVHRVAYAISKGEIPDGLVLDHTCRNRLCCNPDHLEPVPVGENIKRGNLGARRRLGCCKRGHVMTPENTYQRQGRRPGTTWTECMTCRREDSARRYHLRTREAVRSGGRG